MAYDNPAGIIAASVILELLAVTAVGLRFYSRRHRKAHFIVSDWLILASMIGATGLTVLEIYGVSVHALGTPLNGTIQDPHAVTGRLNKAKHIELSFLLLGVLTLGLIKASVTYFYLRIFNTRVFRRILIFWLVIIALWTLSFLLAGLLECGSHLLSLFGTPNEYLHHCGSSIPSGWALVGSDVATDVVTIVLPVPMIWSLQMPVHRKILIIGTFMIGLVSIGASIGKAYIYVKASLGTYTEDAIVILTSISIWNLVEVQVGIIAACGPTLRPVLSDLVPREYVISLLDYLRGRLSSASNSSNGRHVAHERITSTSNLAYSGAKTQTTIERMELEPRLSQTTENSSKPERIHVHREFAVQQG